MADEYIITHAAIEVIRKGDPDVIITHTANEVIRKGDPDVIITHTAIEVLRDSYPPTDARITHAISEVLREGDPNVRITHSISEVLREGDPNVRITHSISEVLRKPTIEEELLEETIYFSDLIISSVKYSLNEIIYITDLLNVTGNSFVTLIESVYYIDIFSGLLRYKEFISELLDITDICIKIDVLLIESLNYTEGFAAIDFMYLSELITFTDIEYEDGFVGSIEVLPLSDSLDGTAMHYSITLDENIGYVETGYNAKEVDYVVTWRTRTKNPSFGMGGAEYGANVSYGDGNASDLESFQIKVIKTSDSTVLRNVNIPIVDTDDPDADATYTYTIAYNIADNGYFEPNLTFEVYQIDIDSNISPANNIVIEPDIF